MKPADMTDRQLLDAVTASCEVDEDPRCPLEAYDGRLMTELLRRFEDLITAPGPHDLP